MICKECHHSPSGRFNADGMQCYCKCHDVADAAPDLLKACHYVADFLEGRVAHYQELGSHYVAKDLADRAKMLRAAIA